MGQCSGRSQRQLGLFPFTSTLVAFVINSDGQRQVFSIDPQPSDHIHMDSGIIFAGGGPPREGTNGERAWNR